MKQGISYIDFFSSVFDAKIDREVLPSVFAEENRVIPQGEPVPGKWNYANSPLTREIVDILHPDNPKKYIAIMKSAQYGVSDGVIHNGINYLMKFAPCPILLTAGDGDLVKKAMGERIPAAIRGANLYDLIRPNSERKGKGRQSGDTLLVKQFPMGSLTAQTIQSLNKMRQTTFQVGFLDDFESAVLTNESKDGDVFAVVKARFSRYADRMKAYLISTPTLKDTSKIYPAYMMGDQRKWMVKCPNCGEFIELKMIISKEASEHGLIYDVEEGRVIEESVRYRCQKCKSDFFEKDKRKVVGTGKWVPTATPKSQFYTSYHLSDIYSLFGTSWFDLCEEREDARIDKNKFKAFLNLRLGVPYEEKKQAVRIATISQNTREYEILTIPNELSNHDGNGDIKLLTIACDLAGIIGEDETEDDVRLDYEIVAHSETGSTYSIDAGSIGTYKGSKKNKSTESRKKYTYRHGFHNSVWNELQEIIDKDYYTEDGEVIKISICVIDSGHATTEVYEFLDKNKSSECNVFGIKEKGEEKTISVDLNTKIFNPSQTRPQDCFIVVTAPIKDQLAEYVKKNAFKTPQEANTMNFPSPSAGKYTVKNYFMHYEAEVKKPEYDSGGALKGYKWNKKHSGSDDHFKDCRVYNLIARDMYVRLIAQYYKNNGYKIDVNAFYWANFCKL